MGITRTCIGVNVEREITGSKLKVTVVGAPDSNEYSGSATSKPMRRTFFVADLKCYMCGSVAGSIESEQSLTVATHAPHPVLLRQPGPRSRSEYICPPNAIANHFSGERAKALRATGGAFATR